MSVFHKEGQMVSFNSRREGFALAGAVLAMLVVGAIVTGGFYAVNQQSQITRSVYFGDLAQYIAETGLEATVGRTNARVMDRMALNEVRTMAASQNVSNGGVVVGNYTTTLTKMTPNLFVVRSTGQVTRGGPASGATRTVANIVRLRVADFDQNTAMMVFGNLDVGGTADVDGDDTFLNSWSADSCTTSDSSSAVVAQPGATIDESGGSGGIDGEITRRTLSPGDFFVFGDLSWNDVVAMATSRYPAGTVLSQIDPVCTPGTCTSAGATCVTSNINNWGAPEAANNACFNHFPIIYAEGDLHITENGDGQGILLVEGGLSITSQFDFYGIVVVKGILDIGAGGSTVTGSVLAYGGGNVGNENSLAGNTLIQFSSCAISRAAYGAQGLSRGVPIKNRSWFDLTSVQNSY
jgi:hypothetical protein